MLHLLIIEDNDDDIFLFRSAIKREGINCSVHFVHNGREAMEYLLGEKDFSDRVQYPWPHLIVTDLKMPVMNGFQLLEWLRNQASCSALPVMVMSASDRQEDIKASYEAGANAYLIKPSTLQDLQHTLRIVCDFWTTCLRPGPRPPG